MKKKKIDFMPPQRKPRIPKDLKVIAKMRVRQLSSKQIEFHADFSNQRISIHVTRILEKLHGNTVIRWAEVELSELFLARKYLPALEKYRDEIFKTNRALQRASGKVPAQRTGMEKNVNNAIAEIKNMLAGIRKLKAEQN